MNSIIIFYWNVNIIDYYLKLVLKIWLTLDFSYENVTIRQLLQSITI